MNLQKILLLFIIAFIMSIIIYFGFFQFNATQNVINSKKIQVDFSKDEMLIIMGEPDSKYFTPLEIGKEVYYYEPPFGASEGIDIYVDTSTNKVARIVYFE